MGILRAHTGAIGCVGYKCWKLHGFHKNQIEVMHIVQTYGQSSDHQQVRNTLIFDSTNR